ncbi:unnamed protein product [Linum trigynum]|uniref:Uncharacterized protein n=1 Tax=Linum trigynum TaxID=586398 RepID=A0AAV2CAT9_9ROSI
MASSIESLTEVTERAAEVSKGSIGAIEAMGDQIKASIEEMGKSVAENICRSLATTMKEVLTQVLRSREQPATVTPTVTLAPTGEKAPGPGGGEEAEAARRVAAREKLPSCGNGGCRGARRGKLGRERRRVGELHWAARPRQRGG